MKVIKLKFIVVSIFLYSSNVEAKTIEIDNSIKDITNILNNAPENSVIKIKNGNYEASGVQIEKNNITILGESLKGVSIKLYANKNGVFFRVGKRGPETDYRSDNLPVYNGTLNYWSEKEFSPSTLNYPRYSNINISNITFLLSDKNGKGVGSGIEYYRVNDSSLNAIVKWEKYFDFGNAVRFHYCKNLNLPFLRIESNPKVIFGMLYYWSYGLKGGDLNFGNANLVSAEFKHSVNSYISNLVTSGDGRSNYRGVNIGYGSINNKFDNLIINNGMLNLKSSVEFDLSRDIDIKRLKIINNKGVGLLISRIEKLNIENYSINAESPIIITTMKYYVGNDKTGKLLKKNTLFSSVGDYLGSDNENNYNKFYDYRPFPILKNANFKQGNIVVTGKANYGILANISKEANFINKNYNELVRFNNKDIRKVGYKENLRNIYSFNNSLPFSLENVNLNNMIINNNSNNSLKAFVYLGVPVINSKGNIQLYGKGKETISYWLDNSDIKLNKESIK